MMDKTKTVMKRIATFTHETFASTFTRALDFGRYCVLFCQDGFLDI